MMYVCKSFLNPSLMAAFWALVKAETLVNAKPTPTMAVDILIRGMVGVMGTKGRGARKMKARIMAAFPRRAHTAGYLILSQALRSKQKEREEIMGGASILSVGISTTVVLLLTIPATGVTNM